MMSPFEIHALSIRASRKSDRMRFSAGWRPVNGTCSGKEDTRLNATHMAKAARCVYRHIHVCSPDSRQPRRTR